MIIQICLYISFMTTLVISVEQKDCVFDKHASTAKKNGEDQIEVMKGRRFTASDENYEYDIGICIPAIDIIPDEKADDWATAGVIQINKKDRDSTRVVGRVSSVDIMAGPEWVILEYNNGDVYGSHCMGADGKTQEQRRARIMFVCDMSAPDERAIVLEEQNNKTDACYYLFEINTAAVCPKQPFVSVGLSVGSVFLILFVSLAGVYFLGGCLYSRFVLHAKGIEQMPNLSFWEDFGNLQADGCDFVCRTRKSRQPRTYKGVGDDQLGEDTLHTDENLLPM